MSTCVKNFSDSALAGLQLSSEPRLNGNPDSPTGTCYLRFDETYARPSLVVVREGFRLGPPHP